MKMKKMLAALGTVLFCCGGAANLPARTDAAEETFRIMCVGDSITHGYINADNGYRKYLCYYLQQNGIAYDMVGPENGWTESAVYDWNGTSITYDPQHCGYSGYSTMSYSGRTGIYETLFGNGNLIQTYAPDIVLLQIGTNDLLDASLDIRTGVGDIRETTTALDRLETVVDEILANLDSSDMLFVTTIPDIDAVTCASWVSSYQWTFGITAEEIPAKVQECVDSYNAGVKALVAEKQAAGKNVQLGDVNSVVDYTAGDLEDGCHPSEQGYAKMGAHWAETIAAYLGNAAVPPVTEESTEATTIPSESVDNMPMFGDVNDDAAVDILDIIKLQKYLLALDSLNERNFVSADLNADGEVNAFDLAHLKYYYVLSITPMPW